MFLCIGFGQFDNDYAKMAAQLPQSRKKSPILRAYSVQSGTYFYTVISVFGIFSDIFGASETGGFAAACFALNISCSVMPRII